MPYKYANQILKEDQSSAEQGAMDLLRLVSCATQTTLHALRNSYNRSVAQWFTRLFPSGIQGFESGTL